MLNIPCFQHGTTRATHLGDNERAQPPYPGLNLVNRLGQADAMQRSGSDVLTEQKLASLLGRRRIEKGFEQEFRGDMARSVGPTIFDRIKIALAAGAGPTVG